MFRGDAAIVGCLPCTRPFPRTPAATLPTPVYASSDPPVAPDRRCAPHHAERSRASRATLRPTAITGSRHGSSDILAQNTQRPPNDRRATIFPTTIGSSLIAGASRGYPFLQSVVVAPNVAPGLRSMTPYRRRLGQREFSLLQVRARRSARFATRALTFPSHRSPGPCATAALAYRGLVPLPSCSIE